MKWFYKWVKHIQDIVEIHTVKPNECAISWIFIVVMDMMTARRDALKNVKEVGDQVMGMAFDLGLVLLGWSMRTQLAKCHDPRRPKRDREMALAQFCEKSATIINILNPTPTREEKKIYKQRWSTIKSIKEIQNIHEKGREYAEAECG